MDRAILHRPRHILASVAVVVLLGGGAGLTVGLANANGQHDLAANFGPDSAVAFQIPMPNVGDRAAYAITFPNPATIHGSGDWGYDFTWLADEQVPGLHGGTMWANHILTKDVRGDDSRDEDHFLPAGSLAADILRVSSSQTDATPGSVPDPSGQVRTNNWTSLFYMEGTASLPCGLRNPFQGGEIALGQVVPDEHPCSDLPNPGETKDVELRVARIDSGDMRVEWWMTLGYNQGVPDGPAVYDDQPTKQGEFVYRAGIPYPVTMEFPTQRWTMTGFTRGTVLARSASDAAMPTQWVFQPLDVDGPDETGVVHPFPLSEAFASARTGVDPELATYLGQHPGAVMVWARHIAFDGHVDSPTPLLPADQHRERWSFGVSDGGSIHETGIERRWTHQIGNSGAPADVKVDPDRPFSDMQPVSLDKLPQTMPSVASMLAQWRPWGDPNQVGNDWGFCFMEQADGYPIQMVWAGDATSTSTAAFPGLQADTTTWRATTMTWAPDGTAKRFDRSEQTDQPAGAAPLASTPPAPVAPAPGVVPASTWIAPTPVQATTVAFGALVAGLAYYLWPLAKGGAVGLFSKTRDNELLDNPVRRRIVEAVQAQPGIHYQALLRVLGESNGTMEHHLAKLTEAGLLKAVRAPGYTCYFPAGTDDRFAKAGPALRAPAARKLLDLLRKNPGMTPQEAARRLGIAPATVYYHLERLRAAGLVAAGTLQPTETGMAIAASG
ncbi:MAG: helix-turn-helix domain-containing protein [bacterium]